MARGTKDNKYLVSKLFDVTEHSQLEDCLHTEEKHYTVPFGRGIVGTVALDKHPINIKDAYQVNENLFLSLSRKQLPPRGESFKFMYVSQSITGSTTSTLLRQKTLVTVVL